MRTIVSLQGKIAFLQLAVFLFSANHAVEDDVALIDATDRLLFPSLAFLAQIFQPFVEVPMCLENHPKVLGAALEEELERGHPVEEDAIKDNAMHTLLWQILHQQRKVVAEVQVGLTW